MPLDSKREKEIEKWLSKSNSELESADLLYNHKLFSQALYFLQQSNEKLAKGLLIKIGILTPKIAKKDLRVKALLGFSPKKPEFYGHRVMKSFLSDMEKTVPSIEELYKLIENSEWKPQITEFQRNIRKSKKGIQKLKKRPFNLIDNAEKLENEIKAAQEILAKMDQTIDNVSQEIDRLDFAEIVRVAITITGQMGLNTDGEKGPSLQDIKRDIADSLKLSILVTLSVAFTSFLDPLEAVTRYPDLEHDPFNENNPYITHFKEIHDLISLTLKKAKMQP